MGFRGLNVIDEVKFDLEMTKFSLLGTNPRFWVVCKHAYPEGNCTCNREQCTCLGFSSTHMYLRGLSTYPSEDHMYLAWPNKENIRKCM